MGEAGGVRRHVASNPDDRLNSNSTFRGLGFWQKISRRCPGFQASRQGPCWPEINVSGILGRVLMISGSNHTNPVQPFSPMIHGWEIWTMGERAISTHGNISTHAYLWVWDILFLLGANFQYTTGWYYHPSLFFRYLCPGTGSRATGSPPVTARLH